MMNIIKKLREERGYTQKVLAEKTGLSLRTIQRLETQDNPPKGHSLLKLSEVFNLDPITLQKKTPLVKQEDRDSDKQSINLINLSILAFFVFPLGGNILFPFLLWRKKRASKLVEEMGRKIVNFQIIWTILLYFLLCISPFLSPSFPLILVVLFFALGINIIIIFFTAYQTQRDKFDFLNLPLSLI